jgi:hypothetical protein
MVREDPSSTSRHLGNCPLYDDLTDHDVRVVVVTYPHVLGGCWCIPPEQRHVNFCTRPAAWAAHRSARLARGLPVKTPTFDQDAGQDTGQDADFDRAGTEAGGKNNWLGAPIARARGGAAAAGSTGGVGDSGAGAGSGRAAGGGGARGGLWLRRARCAAAARPAAASGCGGRSGRRRPRWRRPRRGGCQRGVFQGQGRGRGGGGGWPKGRPAAGAAAASAEVARAAAAPRGQVLRRRGQVVRRRGKWCGVSQVLISE